jgi:hypothetical protein
MKLFSLEDVIAVLIEHRNLVAMRKETFAPAREHCDAKAILC